MTAVSLSGVPIPNATVLPAPAAGPLDITTATLGAAPAPVTPPTGAGGDRLEIPAAFRDKLAKAVAEGRADAREFAREHRPRERWMVVDWAMLRMAWPPKSDAEDLAYLHEIAATRTDAGVERARFWSKHGLTEEWERQLDDYARKAGPRQARAARKLLHDTLMMMNTITQTAKAGAARQRPFVVDPSLPLAVDKPGNNPSYPSGHTTAAFAAGMVLAHLMPDRREEFMEMAREASWARVYSGVHFPTDVLAGAKMASTVASYLTGTSDARPIRGTRGSVNPGVAGGRRAIPGAPVLHGAPLPGAQPASPASVMRPGQPGT